MANGTEMMGLIPQLKDYNVSENFGFILTNPLDSLPEYFNPWECAAKNFAELVNEGQMRNVIDKMPLLDHTRLSLYNEQRLAYLFLTFLGNGYVWQEGDKGVVKVLPKQISIPLCALCKILGGQPCISHMGQALANYTLKDPSGPIHMSNMKTVVYLPGGMEYEWFTLVTLQIEIEGVPAIKASIKALKAVQNHDEDGLVSALETMTAAVKQMKEALKLMHQNLKGETFYHNFRPYLAGWTRSSTALPNGLIYEGVSAEPKEVAGGSAAQSSLLHTFDAVLGVTHEPDKQAFLDSMLDYMPLPHRNFILAIRKCTPVNSFVKSAGNATITQVFNECMTALQDFRTYHIQIVTKYIVSQAAVASSHKNAGLASTGTGGTDLLPFLKSIRDTTAEVKIS